MADLGMPLDFDLHVKLVFIFMTSGGSCARCGLIITLLDLRISLHIFTTKHIKLKAMSRPMWLCTPVARALLPHQQSGIHQYIGGITELHLLCYLSSPINLVMFQNVCMYSYFRSQSAGFQVSFVPVIATYKHEQYLNPPAMSYEWYPSTNQGTTYLLYETTQ